MPDDGMREDLETSWEEREALEKRRKKKMVYNKATGKWQERAPQSRGMKGVMDDLRKKRNPTDKKVAKALKDAGV